MTQTDWLWSFVELANSGIEVLLLFAFCRMFFKRPAAVSKNFSVSVGAGACLVIYVVSFWLAQQTVMISVVHIVAALAVALLFAPTEIMRASLCTVVFFAVAVGIEVLSGVLVSAVFAIPAEEIAPFGTARFLGLILKNIILFIAIKGLSRIRHSDSVALPIKTWITAMFFPLTTGFTLLKITQMMFFEPNRVDVLGVFSTLALLYSNFLVFWLIDKVSLGMERALQLQQTEALLQVQKESIVSLAKSQDTVRQAKHDVTNTILCISQLLERREYPELENYVSQIAKQQARFPQSVSTGNPTLDVLLSSKYAVALGKDISCSWTIDIPAQLELPELEISVLLGNALDNAIEACHGEGDTIHLEMARINNNLLVEILNPVYSAPIRNGTGLRTTKSDASEHGFGLRSMEHICKNLGGEMNLLFDEKQFQLRIILPLMTA